MPTGNWKQDNGSTAEKNKTVILADGSYPVHEIPLDYLRHAARIICCDGSAETLIADGFIPDAIVGDLDSLSNEIASRFPGRIYRDDEQKTNDLTKSVKWCFARNYTDIVILGATGKREDHTIGNISLLADYVKQADVIMVTDTGIISPHLKSSTFSSFPGQQVSIFSINPETEITSTGLKYRLEKMKLVNWWQATLNEATDNFFELVFEGGPLLVYRKFRE
ncbi:MAG: thiamine diphosphokinase [Bacteroidales bacterium]|nr:thiamine diphosphokinase [Bacteroidales bacterium]